MYCIFGLLASSVISHTYIFGTFRDILTEVVVSEQGSKMKLRTVFYNGSMLTLPSTSIDGANIPWIVLVRRSRALSPRHPRRHAEVTSS